MKYIILSILTILISSCQQRMRVKSYEIIPHPKEIFLNDKECFILDENCVISIKKNDSLELSAHFLANYIKEACGHKLAIKHNTQIKQGTKTITIKLTNDIQHPEGYSIQILPKKITLKASTFQGIFYGIQTLRNSIPHIDTNAIVEMPCVEIRDEPRFCYRGMHLDVSRHFFSVEFIKEFIDLLALHKMNTFHWHLTDDQGWRIEIKKYPLLTEIGSIRKQTVIGKNSGKYDGEEYKGYYTQEQIKELIQYAAQRHVTIIPEIDLPGHMLAALAAYPELGCTEGPYEVASSWGVFHDVLCIGNKKSMDFIKDIMDEITNLFPSKLIHIGGDEAPRTRWKECPKCQSLIRKLGLNKKKQSPEDLLQSYCMNEIEKFLKQKGKTIIGWDEILKGEIAPNAIVMSWQGTIGGIRAAQMRHQVIMAPNTHCYLNYYQHHEVHSEPFAIGGYIPLQKVYELEPTTGLTKEQAAYILGVEGTLWSEYITTPKEAEYMLLPRLAALAEVQWSKIEEKDYQAFLQRVANQTTIYKKNNWEYAKHLFDLKASYKPNPTNKSITVKLNILGNHPIYYTTDGEIPTTQSNIYKDSVVINKSCSFKAISISKQGRSNLIEEKINCHKAMLKPISLNAEPHIENTFAGAITLVDGLRGKGNYNSGSWIGFDKADVIASIDLEETTTIQKVEVAAYADVAGWIMGSSGIIVENSLNGIHYEKIAEKEIETETNISAYKIENYTVNFAPTKAKHLRITIKRSPSLPKGHVGAGYAPLLFIDEIIVE